MISMLRLINPPGHRRRKPFPRYSYRNPDPPGAPAASTAKPNPRRKLYGAAAAAHAAKVAKLQRRRKAKVAKANPVKRRRVRKLTSNPRRKTMVTKKVLRARARRQPRYTSGPKKGKFKPAGGPRRHKVKRHRKARRNPPNATLSAAKATYAPRKHVKKHKTHRKTVRKTTAAPRKHKVSRRKYRVVTVFKAKRRRTAKKLSTYKVIARNAKTKITRGRRKGKMAHYRRFTVRRTSRNPNFGAMLRQGAMLYGGLVGMRLVSGLIRQYVMPRLGASLPAQIVPVLPAAVGVALAGFAPRFIKNTSIVSGLQMGAVIAAFDALYTTFVKPTLMKSAPQVAAMLSLDDIGYGQYGAYVPQIGEYTQPARQQLGAEVTEAMALDEYVQGDGLGLSVNEALADSEVQGFQTGYAAGSLSRTVFSS